MDLDVIIRNGDVIDGTGEKRRRLDIGIKGDRIVALGDLSSATAKKIVDASGQVVTPGFIDMHSHSDQTILKYPSGESSIGQGITTSVGGQCGFSPAPLNDHWLYCWWEANWWDKVAPRMYYDEPVGSLKKAKQAAIEHDFSITWSSFAQWLDTVEQSRPGINICPLVGHGTIRAAVMGSDYRRYATSDEINAMKRYAEEAMDAGANGISNGVDYAPNSYCSVEESYEVIGAVAKKGGLFSTHWRRTGLRKGFGNPGLINGIKEAIDIADKTGAKIQIAHLSPGYQVSPSSTPGLTALAAEETLAVIDDAIKQGIDATFDVIPNHLTGGVIHWKYVATTLLPWLKQAGSLERLAHNLKAPDMRQEIRKYIMAGKWFMLNPIVQPGWASRIKVGRSDVEKFQGKTIAEIAEQEDVDFLEALMNVVSKDPRATTAWVEGPEGDKVKRIFYEHPFAMVGIDTFIVDHTYEVTVPPYTLPNPNTFGGMARFIKMYALGLLGLEEGIRRLTSLPAETLGLKDRGLIAEGKKADLVVFEPNKVQDKGTEEEPRQYPHGFNWVLVNGVIAMENGKFTKSRTGEVLRR